MSKATWGDVKKGDVVELAGREYRVVKCKPKGKRAAVMVETKGRYAESIVKLKEPVKILKRKADVDPLFDENGRAQRWATKREAREVGVTLKAGDARQTKPPMKAEGGSWEKPRGGAEKAVASLLEARLVGVATDEDAGYYVPPVDVTTVASHLALFHGGIGIGDDEAAMLAAHTAQHAEALKGSPLAVNHWHTKERPKA